MFSYVYMHAYEKWGHSKNIDYCVTGDNLNSIAPAIKQYLQRIYADFQPDKADNGMKNLISDPKSDIYDVINAWTAYIESIPGAQIICNKIEECKLVNN